MDATQAEALLRLTPKQRMARRVVKAVQHLCFAAIAYALVVLAARLLHRRVHYQPPAASTSASASAAPPAGAVVLTAAAADGATTVALDFAPAAPRASGRTIVHFHGNADLADDYAAIARDLTRRGFEVVLVEYRGYGRARVPGGRSPTEVGLYADAEAILGALAARGTRREDIVLWGQSLGSGVATEMALRGRGARLILAAPFTSTVEVASRIVPFLPTSLIMVDRFDNLAKAPKIDMPAFVVHGDSDDVVPHEFGERVSRAFPHGSLLTVEGGRHDNLYKNASTMSALAAFAAKD